MENLKNMIFGAKPRAVKWLGMSHSDGQHSNHMFIHPEATTEVLQPLGDQPINLISIFGAARQGKSFLMNLLAGQQDLFKISNLREPCTQGIDLSAHFVSLSTFSSLNGCPPLTTHSNPIQIGFVDAEGQGDRDITYDSRLVSPVLLSSKVVLFNWKDSLQSDRILNLLAVLARAAQGIEVADTKNAKVFGHLHIVFRDWSFVDSSPQDVYRDLFSTEKGRSEEANVRNLARIHLIEAFESITVWLFPAPVANTANLKDKIRFEQLQGAFQEKLRDLRKVLSTQLQKSMEFGGQPLTAKLLSKMMPCLVETLNSDQVIMPESIYSSMARAEAKSIKDQYVQEISDYCEVAGIEELVSADAFQKMLEQDVDFMITQAMDKVQNMPKAVREEMNDALREFATKEITIALQLNNEKISQRLSIEVDTIFENLKNACEQMELNDIPMKTDILRERWKDLLDQELARLDVFPTGSQGRRGIDTEMNRVRQHASILLDKVEVANEKSIQKANAVVNEKARTCMTQMTKKTHEHLDKVFSVRTPVTIAILQASLDDLYRSLLEELSMVERSEILSTTYIDDLEHHKSQLAEELNRRYYLEIRQILSEVGYTAKEDLGKEVALRLDGKLPLSEELIKSEIDESVQQVKMMVAKQLQGWTVLKSDIAAKSMELEKLGDVYTYEYLKRNQDVQNDVTARQAEQQYEDLKSEVVDEFLRELKKITFPIAESQINAMFWGVVKDLIEEFLSIESTLPTFSASILHDKLMSDCRPDVENQKTLNRLAIEKADALKIAERERQAREQEIVESRRKEEQMNELKSLVEKSIEERDLKSKQLQDQLRAESDRTRQLRDEVESMKRRAAEAEAIKKDLEYRARVQALQDASLRQEESEALKQQLDELRMQAAQIKLEKQRQAHENSRREEESRQLASRLDEMRRQSAKIEAEKYALKMRARQESARREEAENAARAAAEAAALAARAAIEAAASEVSPFRLKRDPIQNKRKVSQTNADEDQDMMEIDHHNGTTPRQSESRVSRAKLGERKKRKMQSTGSTPTKSHSSLEEARQQAKAAMERRIEERASMLSSKKKK